MNYKGLLLCGSILGLGGTCVAYGAGQAASDDEPSVAIGRSKDRDVKRPPLETEKVIYQRAIQRTSQMVSDETAQRLAGMYGLNVLNLTWEDTGRYKGSAVGPNISDMTIQVGFENPATRGLTVTCMPVIRYPNFSDVSCDLDPRDFTLLVGNHRGTNLKRLSLYDLLANPSEYMTKPESWKSRLRTMLADRDTKVLVSAQACFLPVPQKGKATFNPVLFNYQSMSGDPAVLTILATREGTSMTIIDNKRDAFSNGSLWGQRLFHNAQGMRASLTGERLSDYRASKPGGTVNSMPGKESGLNMVLLIQVPLKQKHAVRDVAGEFGGGGLGGAPAAKSAGRANSDVENAVIGHGDLEGPFTEVDNLDIERDPRFPVRVTVQFYKATSNGIVSETDMREIKDQIDRVYKMSDSVGSLVTQGETGRATEYEGLKIQPANWWAEFWHRHQANTGDSPDVAIAKLMKLLGREFRSRPVNDLYLHDLLRKRP